MRVDDALYVRSIHGPTAARYRQVHACRRGTISFHSISRSVIFADALGVRLNKQVDGAYRFKYRRYGCGILDVVTSPEAQLTTLRVLPSARH